MALAVDGSEMFNQIAKTFYSKTSMRFIILLWEEKSDLNLIAGENKEVPIFSFMEVIDLGRESRMALSDSHEARKSTFFSPNSGYIILKNCRSIIFENLIIYGPPPP